MSSFDIRPAQVLAVCTTALDRLPEVGEAVGSPRDGSLKNLREATDAPVAVHDLNLLYQSLDGFFVARATAVSNMYTRVNAVIAGARAVVSAYQTGDVTMDTTIQAIQTQAFQDSRDGTFGTHGDEP